MVGELLVLHAAKMSSAAIGERVGMSKSAVGDKLRRLGLSKGRHSGRPKEDQTITVETANRASAMAAAGVLRSEIAAACGFSWGSLRRKITEFAHQGVRTSKDRPCITCERWFVSEWVGHRMCDPCRGGSSVTSYSTPGIRIHG